MPQVPTAAAPLWRDFDLCYRAVSSRDSRFDGQFITGVRTTGIYCRPSCPATTPQPRNVRFYPTAAAAQAAGLRACRRCLPDAVPGSPAWDVRADLAARAMRLISDGVVEREGVPGLAQRVGYSERQLGRVLTTELGAGPLALARAHRSHAARLLIERSTLSFSDVAFAAGFSSVRQFNDTVRAVFDRTPSQLRATAGNGFPASDYGNGTRLTLRLPLRPPFDAAGIFGFLAARAIRGVETATDHGYARTLRLPHGIGTVRLQPAADHVLCTLRLTDLRDLGSAVTRVRRLLDLDADPAAVDTVLAGDPALASSVADVPGIRVPGAVDRTELLVRALVGQQVTVAAARTALIRLAAAAGEPLSDADGDLTTLFPTAAAVAEHARRVLRGPRARTAAVVTAAEAIATGALALHVGRDHDELRDDLLALPGVGPWTADYLLMRVLGAPDVLLTGDAALRNGAKALGLPTTPATITQRLEPLRPWRSYAVMHLWRAAANHQEEHP